ncbi:S8 family serine peptidase [Thermomonospora umbrina]|uniref:S8 family serine peptidase n=1 Tax=Thermomonospora umbrina TaxID=111806 RepID=UPI000E243C9A|nr:S8 family serine peptidase [Thermomonospora umbrina]
MTRITAGLALTALVSAAAVPLVLLPDSATGPYRPGQTRDPATGALRAASRADAVRSRQWHMDAMRVPRVWRWGRGKHVTIAVLDTGVDARHRDLTGQVVTGPDFTGGTRRAGDRYWGGHGTAMASIIAGHGNGPGASSGVLGIAPQAKILSIRVTWENDDPMRRSGTLANRNRDAVAKGIRYAVDHGADIINMSLGGGRAYYNGNSTEEQAIRYALSKGVVLIASAGNDGKGPNRKNFPAAYPGVIAVGALTRHLRIWPDTNRNAYVSVCAPGVDIISAAPGNRYVLGTGTSPSSAIVAGVAALIRARYPKLTPAQVRESLVRGSVKRAASGSAAGSPTTSRTCSRSLDAVRAVTAAHRINGAAHGESAVRTPEPSPPPPTAEAPDEGSNPLLWGILGGGGVLVVTGMLLGWRQRRRPEPEDVYGPPPEPPREYEPATMGVGMPYEPDTKVAPFAAPPWESPAHPGTEWDASPTDSRSLSAPQPFSAPSDPDGAPGPALEADPASGAWSPRPDLHLPPLEPTGNGHTNGNGNGHAPLDPRALHPFAPDAAEPQPPQHFGNGTAAPPPGPQHPRHADTAPQVVDPLDAAAPWGFDPQAPDPLASAAQGADRPGVAPESANPLEPGPWDTDPPRNGPPGTGSQGVDPLGTGPVPPVADTPLAQESWRSVRGGWGDDPFPSEPGAPEASEAGPYVDPGSITAPFSAVGGTNIAWEGTGREPPEPVVDGPFRVSDDDLATHAFPAVDPLMPDEGDAFDTGRAGRAEDDDQRPSWW